MAAGDSVITTAGMTALLTDGYTDFGWLAVGSGTTDFTITSTALSSEEGRSTIEDVSVSGAILTLRALFTNSQANAVLAEWGILDAASGGNLLAGGLFDASVTKESNKQLIVEVEITLANA